MPFIIYSLIHTKLFIPLFQFINFLLSFVFFAFFFIHSCLFHSFAPFYQVFFFSSLILCNPSNIHSFLYSFISFSFLCFNLPNFILPCLFFFFYLFVHSFIHSLQPTKIFYSFFIHSFIHSVSFPLFESTKSSSFLLCFLPSFFTIR